VPAITLSGDSQIRRAVAESIVATVRGESAGRDAPWQATASRTIGERAARIDVPLVVADAVIWRCDAGIATGWRGHH
jgi:hypothetical protein